MKRFSFIALLCSIFALSCEQSNIDNGGDVAKQITSVEATIEGGSRVSATLGSNERMQLKWSSGDKLCVTDLAAKTTFSLRVGSGTTKGAFVGTFGTKSSAVYAAYPTSAIKIDGSRAKMTIPTEQSYSTTKGQNIEDKLQLFGTIGEDGSVVMYPVAAIVNFDIMIADDCKVHSVTMSAEKLGLAGEGVVILDSATLSSAKSNSVTLTYSQPEASPSKGGWAVVAPVDFKSSTDNITYSVVTNKGTYTFCHTPNHKLEAGEVYTIQLSIDKFTQVADKNNLKQGEFHYSGGMPIQQPEPDPDPEVDANLNVRLVRATDSTLSIGWTITAANIPYVSDIVPNLSADYSVDIEKEYKVALYRDAACTDLVYSVSKVQYNTYDNSALFKNPNVPPRFIFAGLEPSTKYFVKVFNTTDGTSNATPVQMTTAAMLAHKSSVVTENATFGDLILYENFSKLVYAGDLTARAAGVSRTDRNKLQSFDGAALVGEIIPSNSGYYTIDAGAEMGLFNTMAGLIDDVCLDDWGWIGGKEDANGGSVCARPGYIKIGTSGNRAFVCTPLLKAIPADKLATLRVVFNAAPNGPHSNELANVSEKFVAVQALSGANISADNNLVTYKEVVDRVEFTLEGDRISDWHEYTVTLKDVPYGSSVAIGGALEGTKSNRMEIDDIRIYVEDLVDAPEAVVAKGTITYTDGTPAVGVSVSDGFTVVQTNENGEYILTPHPDTWYIYYTIPADCQVPINSYGQPAFFTKYTPTRKQYDFKLTKLAGGKETQFSLFCLADPQCKDATHRNRFNNESIPDIKAHSAAKKIPCYGITLGDVAYSEGNRNSSGQMTYLRDHMSQKNAGIPIFQTMGNHDYTFFNETNPIAPDETSSTYNIKIQRTFETVFGPINYSFDRGDVHIVGMRDIIFNTDYDASYYSVGFLDEQYQWLKQDLALVPKDKIVILCVHIPIANSSKRNVQKVIQLLQQFKEAHIMSGHTHYQRNEPTLSGGVYEHVHGAVCGSWWGSHTNGDGTPNGYGVFDFDGNTVKDWYYKGVNEGMNSRDYQIRLYWGNLKLGGEYEQFELTHGENVLLANAWNTDNKWVLKVYEDDVYSGTMTRISHYCAAPAIGNPTKPSVKSSQDWWAISYHIGILGRGHTGGNRANHLCDGWNMYKYTLKNKNAKIRVEATDRFGRTYTATDVIGDYDYTLMDL